jgi:transcriptional regulator with XRE-family HTH domain
MDIKLRRHTKRLGKNIANERMKKNMTQYRLAQKLSTDQSNMARIEGGKINCTVKTLLKISEILDCRVRDFFDF